MIPATLAASLKAYRDDVAAAKPVATLTPLQLASLVSQGRALVVAIDEALAAISTILDTPDPSGHPLVMIADVRARLAAAQDQTVLSDLRGFVGRAVLNLTQGAA